MTVTFVSHCESVYKALMQRATLRRNPVSDEDEMVFIGAVVPVYKSLGISQTYYGPIFRTLEDVGAILKVQQGARGIDTVIILRGLPDVWPEDLGWKGSNSDPLTEGSRYAKVLQDIAEIQKGSIGGIDVILALAEMEIRVGALESKMRQMESEASSGT